MTIPKHIMDEAAICFGEMLEKGQVLSATDVYWNAAICRNIIAQALLAAEQRGREMAAQIAADYAKRAMGATPSAQEAAAAAMSIAAAIRSRTTEG